MFKIYSINDEGQHNYTQRSSVTAADVWRSSEAMQVQWWFWWAVVMCCQPATQRAA